MFMYYGRQGVIPVNWNNVSNVIKVYLDNGAIYLIQIIKGDKKSHLLIKKDKLYYRKNFFSKRCLGTIIGIGF